MTDYFVPCGPLSTVIMLTSAFISCFHVTANAAQRCNTASAAIAVVKCNLHRVIAREGSDPNFLMKPKLPITCLNFLMILQR